MRTGWKGVLCGRTSKLLSRTTDDCHPWHSNLCHGQMTTFILSVDRHAILKRFREEAPLFTKTRKMDFLKSTLPSEFTEVISVLQEFWIICYSYEEPLLYFV